MFKEKINNFSYNWVKETSVKYKIIQEDDFIHESLYNLVLFFLFLYVLITLLLFYYLNLVPLDFEYFKIKNAIEYVIVGTIFFFNILYYKINQRYIKDVCSILQNCSVEEKFALLVLRSYYESSLQTNILIIIIILSIFMRLIIFQLFIGFELGDYNCLICEIFPNRTKN